MLTLALNILDIVQNSVRAKSTDIRIFIRESVKKDILEIKICDNGSGMPVELLKNVTDPFVTTRKTRKVGLGLPLLKYQAEIAGGSLQVDSIAGKGTTVIASFSLSHIDRQPLGDIVGVMTILISANPDISFLYTHFTDKGEYIFSSGETKEYLGINDFRDSGLLSDIREMINENLKEIGVTEPVM
jgi:hypothetical protein